MKKNLFLIFFLCCSKLLSAQPNSKLYRFINTKSAFIIQCPNSADLCFINYNNGSEFLIDLGFKESLEYDHNKKLLGKYYFTDSYSGHYIRNRDKKRLNFRIAQPSDFGDLVSDKKVAQDLIGRKIKKIWNFDNMEEFIKIVRISNEGTNRKLSFHLRDHNIGQDYFMVIEVNYKLEINFEIENIKVISYNKI